MESTERTLKFLNKNKGKAVFYRGGFGNDKPTKAVLRGSELSEEKHSIIVSVDVKSDRDDYIFCFWGYPDQIEFDDLKTQIEYKKLLE